MDMAIRCQGLVKRFGDVVALDGLDLNVPAGLVYGFLGPNGAGKTTAIRLLTGLDSPTAGHAVVAGMELFKGGLEVRRRIGYLPQQPEFYRWMTGRELLEFVGRTFGMDRRRLRARADQVLEQTGLASAARRRVGGYSGGMKQRLALAQALINEPEILFLDEPVSALDPAGRRDILEIIAGLRGRVTVLMSTHILADVERVCDVVGVIDRGKLITEASIAELEARYAQPVFLLEPEVGQDGKRVETLAERIQAQPWASGVTVDHGLLRVVAEDPRAAAREILPLVVASEVVLSRMERVRPSLEDIFLRLVGDSRVLHGEEVR